MDILDYVIKIGSTITAIGLIWKAVNAIVRLSKDMKETKEIVKKNLTNIQDIPAIKQHCEENYMNILRLTIMSSEMPIGERIIAGHKYIENNGNGEVKKFVKNELHIDERKHI